MFFAGIYFGLREGKRTAHNKSMKEIKSYESCFICGKLSKKSLCSKKCADKYWNLTSINSPKAC